MSDADEVFRQKYEDNLWHETGREALRYEIERIEPTLLLVGFTLGLCTTLIYFFSDHLNFIIQALLTILFGVGASGAVALYMHNRTKQIIQKYRL